MAGGACFVAVGEGSGGAEAEVVDGSGGGAGGFAATSVEADGAALGGKGVGVRS